jgi:hypothetical protein
MWRAYDRLEPIDAAGELLRGFAGARQAADGSASTPAQTWQDHYRILSEVGGKKRHVG